MAKKSVRTANAGDVPALIQIRCDAVAYKLSHGDFAWGKSGWTEAAALRTLGQGGMYVVEQDGITVAMMSLSWQDEKYWGPQAPDAGYVHGISVREGFHGFELGSFAIEWCADRVRANSRTHLRLDCDASNTTLCAYYESLGFIRVSTRPVSPVYTASLYERAV